MASCDVQRANGGSEVELVFGPARRATPVEAAGHLLAHVQARAQLLLSTSDHPLAPPVVTIPAGLLPGSHLQTRITVANHQIHQINPSSGFTDKQREAVAEAVRLAGLPLPPTFLASPTAAALTFAADMQPQQLLLVVELGAGFASASVAEVGDGAVQTLSLVTDPDANHPLCGLAIDEAVMEHLLHRHGRNLVTAPAAAARTAVQRRALQRLRAEVASGLAELAANGRALVQVDLLAGELHRAAGSIDIDGTSSVSDAVLETLDAEEVAAVLAPWLRQRLPLLAARAVLQAGVADEDIAVRLLLGSRAGLPGARTALQPVGWAAAALALGSLGVDGGWAGGAGDPTALLPNPERAAAYGAGLHAAHLSGVRLGAAQLAAGSARALMVLTSDGVLREIVSPHQRLPVHARLALTPSPAADAAGSITLVFFEADTSTGATGGARRLWAGESGNTLCILTRLGLERSETGTGSGTGGVAGSGVGTGSGRGDKRDKRGRGGQDAMAAGHAEEDAAAVVELLVERDGRLTLRVLGGWSTGWRGEEVTAVFGQQGVCSTAKEDLERIRLQNAGSGAEVRLLAEAAEDNSSGASGGSGDQDLTIGRFLVFLFELVVEILAA